MRQSFSPSSLIARCLLMAAVMAATTALAAVRGIIVTPDPTIIGYEYTCSSDEKGNTDDIANYKWEVKWKCNGEHEAPCETPWGMAAFGGMANNFLSSATVPGTYSTRLTVTYMPTFGDDEEPLPPPPPTVDTEDIIIAKADGVRLAGGFDEETFWENGIQLEFQVLSEGHDCGPHISGTAQERLTNQTYLGEKLLDTIWMPPSASPTFFLQDGIINDMHHHGLSEVEWNNLEKGALISFATHELRIAWNDPCHILPHLDQTLGSVDIVHRKVSATTWKVEGTIVIP